jgi:hypothetical protein
VFEHRSFFKNIDEKRGILESLVNQDDNSTNLI